MQWIWHDCNDMIATCKITSVKCMAISLSTFADNLTEKLHKGKYKDCKPSLEYVMAKENTLRYNCFECHKSYGKKL